MTGIRLTIYRIQAPIYALRIRAAPTPSEGNQRGYAHEAGASHSFSPSTLVQSALADSSTSPDSGACDNPTVSFPRQQPAPLVLPRALRGQNPGLAPRTRLR